MDGVVRTTFTVHEDDGTAYLVTRSGVSRGRWRRPVRVEQAAPCVMCLTDSADPCTCVGYCGEIICGGDDPD